MGSCIITIVLKVPLAIFLHYTVMIHFLQFMNFGSGVTFYKGQAKVQNGYHPTCTFCKINFYHLKAEQTVVKDVFAPSSLPILLALFEFKGAIIESK